MTLKEELHRLVDTLDEKDAPEALEYLRWLVETESETLAGGEEGAVHFGLLAKLYDHAARLAVIAGSPASDELRSEVVRLIDVQEEYRHLLQQRHWCVELSQRAFRHQFAGRWIAIDATGTVVSGTSPRAAIAEARRLGAAEPYVHYVSEEERRDELVSAR